MVADTCMSCTFPDTIPSMTSVTQPCYKYCHRCYEVMLVLFLLWLLLLKIMWSFVGCSFSSRPASPGRPSAPPPPPRPSAREPRRLLLLGLRRLELRPLRSPSTSSQPPPGARWQASEFHLSICSHPQHRFSSCALLLLSVLPFYLTILANVKPKRPVF